MSVKQPGWWAERTCGCDGSNVSAWVGGGESAGWGLGPGSTWAACRAAPWGAVSVVGQPAGVS